MGLSNDLSCEAVSFSCHCNPHRIFSQRFGGFISLHWNPGLRSLSHSHVVPPIVSACKCGTICFTSCCIAAHPFCPRCQSLPLLLFWMNVSSLAPWLLDSHAVRFSVSSGYFSLLNWLLSFFWLCGKAKCIYLHLHLVQKF